MELPTRLILRVYRKHQMHKISPFSPCHFLVDVSLRLGFERRIFAYCEYRRSDVSPPFFAFLCTHVHVSLSLKHSLRCEGMGGVTNITSAHQIFIHSLVFSPRGRVGRNQSPVMRPVWLWHTASWASSWG